MQTAKTDEYAGINNRLTAMMVDWTCLSLLVAPLVFILKFIFVGLILFFVSLIYFTFLEAYTDVGSLGKKLMGIKVITNDGLNIDLFTSFIRAILANIGLFILMVTDIFGLILLLIAIVYIKRSGGFLPHDQITATKTVQIKKALLPAFLVQLLVSIIIVALVLSIGYYAITHNWINLNNLLPGLAL